MRLLTRTEYKVMELPFNKGRIKPGDRPAYVEGVIRESFGNECIYNYLKYKNRDFTWAMDKATQDKGIDIIVDGISVDLKFQNYANDIAYVHELTQWSKAGWVEENSCNEVWWCVAPFNKVYVMDMEDIKNVDISKYDIKKTMYTNATFCMVPFTDIRVKEILDVDFSSMSKYFKVNYF